MAMKVVDSTQKFFDQSYFMEGGAEEAKVSRLCQLRILKHSYLTEKYFAFYKIPCIAKPTFVTKDKCYIFF